MNNTITRKRYLFWPLIVLGIFALGLILVINQPVRQYLPRALKPYIRFLEKVSIFDLRVCLCNEEKTVQFERDDGLIIPGSLYGLSSETPRPGILLLHGNTPLGRKLPLYKILATKFAQQGYLVLTIDQSGFGESGDPFQFNTVDALNRDMDVYAALEYLMNMPNLNPEQLYLIGHSRGGGPTFSVGHQDDRVKKIVAIGPSRRVAERFNDPPDRDYFWRRKKRTRYEVYGKPFPSWFTQELWLKQALSYSEMYIYLDYFSSASHKPLLLIDGELEGEADKQYLTQFFDKISEPKKYITIPNTDHYSNTAGFGNLSFYDQKVINYTVDSISRWLREL